MSLTHMATRSMPKPRAAPRAVCASRSFVPTPSVPDTSRTASPSSPGLPGPKPALAKSKTAPKPPSDPSQPAMAVALASGLMRSTSALPASMDTPAAAYVKGAASGTGAAASRGRGAKRAPAAPSRTLASASTSAGPSNAWTAAFRDSGVAPAATGIAVCATTAPASTSSVTRCTVQPVSASPAARTAAWTSRSMPPACAGKSDGCTLRHRPRQRRQKASEKMRIQPTQSTTSTPCRSSAAVTRSPYAARSSPFAAFKHSAGTPALAHRSRIGASALFDRQHARLTFASVPPAAASRTAWSDVPRVEPRTPTRRGASRHRRAMSPR
mmetsp:Transcript_8123/g.24139  ORF Transcript_8123/g.24139 Transcript_8123/m.24139 type:complete len:326 (+) Transcript_8123:646-1623(+)